MKTLLAFVVFSAILLATSYFVPVTADSVSIYPDKSMFTEDEQVTFFGTVGETDFSEPVTVIIRDSNDNFVMMGNSLSTMDGKFEVTVNPEPKLMTRGIHTATLYLNDVQTDEKTYFDFSPDGSPIVHTEAEEQLIFSIIHDQNFSEEVSVEDTKIVDSFDNEIDIASVEKPILISADVTNLGSDNQSFTYIVQIKDENDLSVSISWITGVLGSGQNFDVSVSWIPEYGGLYEAEIYVWEKISGGPVLSKPQSIPIIVV